MKTTTLRRTTALLLMCLVSGAASLCAAREEGSFDRSLRVSGSVDLDVSTGSGDIAARAGSASVVRVHATIRANNGWFFGSSDAESKIRQLEANPPIVQEGNYIRIGHIEDPELRRGVSISYEIEAPQQTQLKASSGSGDVAAEGFRGPVNASSGSGDVRASDIGDELSAATGSGDVRANSVRGQVHIITGSGGIQATAISGPFYLHTGSGDIRLTEASTGADSAGGKLTTGSGSVQVTGVNGSLWIQTGSGDITAQGMASGDWNLGTGSGTVVVRLPAQASFNLDAHTDSGSILTRRQVTVQGTIPKGTLRGVVGRGGPLVKLRTGSGDIQVQ
jgi:Putative adhesin